MEVSLYRSVLLKDIQALRQALARGDPVNEKHVGQTPLGLAAEMGNAEIVRELLAAGANPNARREVSFHTPLHDAAAGGHREVVEELLRASADPNLPGCYGETPLHLAVAHRHLEVALLLIEAGGDPFLETSYDKTAFSLAPDVPFRLTLEAVAERSAAKSPAEDLFQAAERGNLESLRRFLQSGESPHQPGPDGITPLHLAALYGRTMAVSTLLDYGADPNVRTALGATPLHFSAHAGHYGATLALIGAGADLQIRDEMGYLPFHRAALRGELPVQELLQRAGALDGMSCPECTTTLFCAAEAGNPQLVQAMLRQSVPADSLDAQGRTPLHRAAEEVLHRWVFHGRVDFAAYRQTIALLVRAGADPDRTSPSGETPREILCDTPLASALDDPQAELSLKL